MTEVPVQDLIPTIERFSVDDIHVGDNEIPWVPYSAEGAFFKPLRLDVRTGAWANLLWIKGPGMLGRHQHHAAVTAYVLEGSWRYKEYDWVATAGSIVHESPGVIHTLLCDDPNGMKTLFFVDGPLSYFGDDGTFGGDQTVFWFIDEYVKHCEANSLPIVDRLFY